MKKRLGRHDTKKSVSIFAYIVISTTCTTCAYPPLERLCGDHICSSGQVCAANQPICVNTNGCGNGIIDDGEICDDGNIVDGETNGSGAFVLDQCNHDCTSTQICGNGIKE